MSLGQQSQVKEISNTKLLVSLNDNWRESANMEIFDVSAKERPRKIYSFEEVTGSNFFNPIQQLNTLFYLVLKLSLIFIALIIIVTDDDGDVTYNSRRNILGAISVGQRISYHLFDAGYSAMKNN